MQKMLGVLHIKKGDDERVAQLDAIQRVAAEFEKVYTSVNKLNTAVAEGTEQIASLIDNLKRKLQELKKLVIQQVWCPLFFFSFSSFLYFFLPFSCFLSIVLLNERSTRQMTSH